MKPLGLLAATAALVLVTVLGATPARAALFELHASLRAGAMTGKGIGGEQQDADFFAGARGFAYGAVVGVEILWIDIYVEHDQFTDFSEITGTWTQLMIGPHFAFPLEEPPAGKQARTYADLALSVGFGVGTGQQIMPPLDDGEISDRGVMIELRVGVEHRFNRFLGVGLAFPLAWGYMFKNDVVNDVKNHYHSFHAMALASLNFRLGL
jgi:hypothetical protein